MTRYVTIYIYIGSRQICGDAKKIIYIHDVKVNLLHKNCSYLIKILHILNKSIVLDLLIYLLAKAYLQNRQT